MTAAAHRDGLPRTGRLAIIAGSGKLPLFLAEAARDAGEDPFVLRLKNEADDIWQGFDTAVIGVGDMAGLSALLRQHDIRRVVMSGAVKRRPAFDDIRVNWKCSAHTRSSRVCWQRSDRSVRFARTRMR